MGSCRSYYCVVMGNCKVCGRLRKAARRLRSSMMCVVYGSELPSNPRNPVNGGCFGDGTRRLGRTRERRSKVETGDGIKFHMGERRGLRGTPIPPNTTMRTIFLSKSPLPLLAFLSTSFLLFLAYSGPERPHGGRFRYPDIPPPGASDDDRLRYSKSPILT